MEITYLGQRSIRLRGRDATVVVDPPSSMGKNLPDIVVRTGGKTDVSTLRKAEDRAQEINGAGEYELKGVSVHNLPVGPGVTLARIEVDEVSVVAAGGLQRQLTEEEIDGLGHVDVLVAPVGGGDVMSAVEAAKLVQKLEPGIVVPICYREAGNDADKYEPLEKFTKEMGAAAGSWQSQPKLNLSGAMGATDETRLVVLDARN